jgi:hypothetical protein
MYYSSTIILKQTNDKRDKIRTFFIDESLIAKGSAYTRRN